MPLEENQVVFNSREAPATRAPVPAIQKVVNKLDRARFDSSLTNLASFPTRHSTSTAFTEAATWARTQLNNMNYATRLQTVAVNGGKSRNIIADKVGAGSDPRQVVIVTAHLDSINLGGGPAASAPGADDNGSGSAGVLEIARVLQDQAAKHDLRLILFGGKNRDCSAASITWGPFPGAEKETDPCSGKHGYDRRLKPDNAQCIDRRGATFSNRD